MLSSTFQGDMGPTPGPKSGAHECNQPAGSPATLDTPNKEGTFSFKHGDGVLGVTTEVNLPHGAPSLSSPFMGDMRPGVDSSKS